MSIVNEVPLEDRQRILDTRLSYWRNVIRMVKQIEALGLKPDDTTMCTQYKEQLFDDLDEIGLITQALGIVQSIAYKKEYSLERLDGAVHVLLEADAEREAENV